MIDDHSGMIYEFDYETESILNQFLIRDQFYRAYEFIPDYYSLSKKMILEEHYIAGFLRKPKKIDKKIAIPDKSIAEVKIDGKEPVGFEASDDLVYIGAKDHQIRGVYFVGKNNHYFRDLTKPPQKESQFRKITYFIAFPLHMMKPDTYRIVVDFKGTLYDSEKYVQIANVI